MNSPPDEPVSNVTHLADVQHKKARAKKSTAQIEPPQSDDGRAVILLTRGTMPAIADASELALANDPLVFNLGGRMGWLDRTVAREANGVERPPGAILFREMLPANLLDRLPLVAAYYRWDGREKEWVKADVPRSVAEVLLARRDDWPNIPQLKGFVEAPTLRTDGSVLDQIGYDRISGLFLVGPAIENYSAPGETKDDARDALERIEDSLFDLPFESDADKSAAVAAVLTGLVRRILPAAPMIGVTAPAAGTGKSKTADVISIIAMGRRAAVVTLGMDANEGDKRLHSALLAGDSVIQLDNIERPLFGDLICQVLTQPMLRLRPLGASAMISTPTNTLLLATGNNLDIRGDLRRRVMLIKLDARVERPERRRFDRELLDDIAKTRGHLVRDALTIIRAYLKAGPITVEPFGGFEPWSRLCREPLIWLDRPDPLLASESLRDQDPDLLVQQQFFGVWFEQFADRPITCEDIIAVGRTNAHLQAALDVVCAERIAPRRLGKWLQRHRGRVLGKHRLDREHDLHPINRQVQWKLIDPKLRSN